MIKCKPNHDYRTTETRMTNYNGIKARRRNKTCKECGKKNTSYEFSRADIEQLLIEHTRLQESEIFLLKVAKTNN